MVVAGHGFSWRDLVACKASCLNEASKRSATEVGQRRCEGMLAVASAAVAGPAVTAAGWSRISSPTDDVVGGCIQ
jgi:hypothetical protein